MLWCMMQCCGSPARNGAGVRRQARRPAVAQPAGHHRTADRIGAAGPQGAAAEGRRSVRVRARRRGGAWTGRRRYPIPDHSRRDAGLAGLAYANIPATTRDTNHGVILVTGQCRGQERSDLEWRALARTGLPLILYMGINRLTDIAEALMTGGLAPDDGGRGLQEATTPRQRSW